MGVSDHPTGERFHRRREKKMRFWKLLAVGIMGLALCTCLSPSVQAAEPGVTDTEIKIGGVVDLSGPIAFMGKGVSRGAATYFKYINDQGGVHGRKINYLVEDDGYSPPKAVAAAKKLIDRDEVFCIFGVLGSAQSLAMYPLLEKARVPLVQPATQNSHIADPPKKYLFLADPNYVTQAKLGIEYALNELKMKSPKVGMIYQDDEPGHDYRDGVKVACNHYKLDLVADVPYKRGTVDFSSHVAKLKEAGADVVMMWTLVREPAGILKEGAKVEYKPVWITATPSTDNMVLELAGDAVFSGKGFYGTMILYEFRPDYPPAAEMLKIWPKYNGDQKTTFYDWYGWGSGKIMVEGLKRAGANPTREGLIKAFETFVDFQTDVFGPITWTPSKRYGNQQCIIVAPKKNPQGPATWSQVGPMRAPKF
jgi:branched-chain amino acid transport system substrate-binding protein